MVLEVTEWQIQMQQAWNNVSDSYRQFIPSEQGESLDQQIFPWNFDGIKQTMQKPLEAHKADPETISHIIQMMSVEMQHWFDYHVQARMTSDPDMKNLLIKIARSEHMHQLMLMSLLPPPHAPSEAVLMGEVALMAAYGMALDREKNDAASMAYQNNFNDHQQHAEFACKVVQNLGCPIDTMTGGVDLSGGKPIDRQFMKPEQTVWQGNYNGSYDKNNVDAITLLNVDMLLAGEMAAWDMYHCAMKSESDQNNKMNFAAFQSIEDQHVAILGSIKDPTETPLERALVHEGVEVSNYGMFMNSESNPQVKKVFKDLYEEDMQHAYLFGQMAK